MIRKLSLLALLSLSACAVPIPLPSPTPAPMPLPVPAPNPQSATERFIRATEANGCEFNQQNASSIMADATLSQEDVARVMTELRADGRGEVVGSTGFRIRSELCA